jgi:signal transduction histidine kinase
MLQNEPNVQPEKQDEYLTILYVKALSLSRLVEDFFELAKLESEEQELPLSKINLTDTAKEAIASFYQTFLEKGITPEITFPPEDVIVIGNENATLRVIQNLLSNALKYGSAGGRIGVVIILETRQARVEVWDCGAGIAPQTLSMLFTRLYTADVSRNHKMSGSGIGLTVAKKLVEKQSGEMTVSSVPNEKTTFAFNLELA